MTSHDATVAGLNVLLVSLAVLVVFYNVFAGWREGVIRQASRIIAAVAAYLAAMLVGPVVGPLLTFLNLPPQALVIVGCLGVGVIVYLALRIASNILFRRTREQESGFIRLLYGMGGAALGLVWSAAFLLGLMIFFRTTGTLGEAQLQATQRQPQSAPTHPLAVVSQLVRIKETLEKGPAGPALKAIDPTPPAVYVTLEKIGAVTADPAAVQRFLDFPATREITSQKAIQDLAADPAVQKLAKTRDVLALATHRKVLAAFGDEKLRPLLQKFELQQALDYSLDASQTPKPVPSQPRAESPAPTPDPTPAAQY